MKPQVLNVFLRNVVIVEANRVAWPSMRYTVSLFEQMQGCAPTSMLSQLILFFSSVVTFMIVVVVLLVWVCDELCCKIGSVVSCCRLTMYSQMY